MTFSVTVLGSSSALPTSTRFPSAHVLNAHERLFLIDCAEGTQIQLRRLRIKMMKINHIFISHLHGDHTLGLIGLISSFNLNGRKSDLHVYAHKGLENNLLFNINFFVNDLNFKVVFHSIAPNKHQVIYDDGKITVESLPLKHKIPSTGFIFREKRGFPNIRKELIEKYSLTLAEINAIRNGSDLTAADGHIIPNAELTFYSSEPRSYAYCSDTMYSEKLIGMIKNVDLLYHEATFASTDESLAKQTGHSTSVQAATIALKSCAKKLIIGHFSSRYKKVSFLEDEARAIFENTIAVEDGQVFEVPIVRR
ncbi:MAG: ribonuclease Z [Bacteroidales bacterium]|nr:MAG: ribonuclease Z [Bacteroidales bacterium]